MDEFHKVCFIELKLLRSQHEFFSEVRDLRNPLSQVRLSTRWANDSHGFTAPAVEQSLGFKKIVGP
jgi:hypothetical protein